MIQDLSIAEYRCPGETYSISRAVHLGRLAGFHPACRHCPRREDTVGLSARQIRQLAEVGSQTPQQLLFYPEGVGNVAISDLGPDAARRIAVEFARRLARGSFATCQTRGNPNRLATGSTRDARSQPIAVVASDGRLATAPIIAAIVEGVRWTGCEVIDIGPASAPCAARAIEHLAADGGIFVGRADGGPHTVGLKFWAHGEPLSQGGLLDDMAAALRGMPGEAAIDRPRRTLGPLRRFSAADVYVNDLRLAYHALRPLRFVLDCSVAPVTSYLEELIKDVACRIVPRETARGPMGRQVVEDQAHFGIKIDDDGENCGLTDERGQSVEATKLPALLAANVVGPVLHGDELRQQTFRRMRESSAAMATDTVGRIWYAADQAPLPDALRTLTLLLVLLSRDDRAFSALLDQGARSV